LGRDALALWTTIKSPGRNIGGDRHEVSAVRTAVGGSPVFHRMRRSGLPYEDREDYRAVWHGRTGGCGRAPDRQYLAGQLQTAVRGGRPAGGGCADRYA